MKTTRSAAKRLLASNKISFIVTAAVVFCATTSGDAAVVLSNGNYTWLLAVLTPFFFVFYDFKKLMYLGADKKDFYLGALAGYGALALLISLANTGVYLWIDPLCQTKTVVNLMQVCGWTENHLWIAFFQQAAFLFLVMVFLHVLLSMQSCWYGWAADIVLTAVLCVFLPVAPLRALLAGFFKIVMLNSHALFHIGVCLTISAALAFAGLAVLKRKTW